MSHKWETSTSVGISSALFLPLLGAVLNCWPWGRLHLPESNTTGTTAQYQVNTLSVNVTQATQVTEWGKNKCRPGQTPHVEAESVFCRLVQDKSTTFINMMYRYCWIDLCCQCRLYNISMHVACIDIFKHSGTLFSASTYVFSKERLLLLWILPFLLSFLFHAFQEKSRLRSGRNAAISAPTNHRSITLFATINCQTLALKAVWW